VDRFFSKLDLRDIKIDPFRTSFPPDADDEPAAEPEPAEPVADAASGERPAPPAAAAEPAEPRPESAVDRRRHVPAWAPEPANGVAPVADPTFEVEVEELQYVERSATLVGTEPAVAGMLGGGDVDRFVSPTGEGLGEVLKVSARSRPSAVAGAIAGVVREAGRAEVQAIGAGATNQAVKAVAIARDYLRQTGIEAICLPAFIDVTIENEDRTAIRLVVEPR